MKRQWRQGPKYVQQFAVPEGPELALCTAIINQAVIDLQELGVSPANRRSAKRFLKEWNIIK